MRRNMTETAMHGKASPKVSPSTAPKITEPAKNASPIKSIAMQKQKYIFFIVVSVLRLSIKTKM